MYGNWTHAGYLNWDTGLGLPFRWHLGRYIGYSGYGLTTLADQHLLAGMRLGGARWIFDRYLDTYVRRAAQQDGGLPPPQGYGITGPLADIYVDTWLALSRYQSHA